MSKYALWTQQVAAARTRLDDACTTVAAILDGGERDPVWVESQELENAALALGRLLNNRPERKP